MQNGDEDSAKSVLDNALDKSEKILTVVNCIRVLLFSGENIE